VLFLSIDHRNNTCVCVLEVVFLSCDNDVISKLNRLEKQILSYFLSMYLLC
jgi:hypothetical protein